VILLAVRWYLRYPLAYEHVAEMLAERGLRWMPVAFGGGSKRMHRNPIKRCRPHLRPTNKSYEDNADTEYLCMDRNKDGSITLTSRAREILAESGRYRKMGCLRPYGEKRSGGTTATM
jgi:hypothetical protein